MRQIILDKKLTVDVDFLKGKTPSHIIGEIIDEDVDIVVGGKGICSYRILPDDITAGMRSVSLQSKMVKTKRMNGTPTQSAVYGAMPRSEGRGMEYCRFTVATKEHPEFLPIISDFNDYLVEIYKKNYPQSYETAMGIMNSIHEDWRWMKGPFLTCNFNVNYAIPYHYDAGNMKNILSNVLILKNRVKGGELVCPELGLTFSQRDGALIIFNGYEILHGVRPITQTDGVGPVYRSSVVYYTLTKCRNCLSKKDETERAKMRYDQHMYKDQNQRIQQKKQQLNILLRKAGVKPNADDSGET